jgi:signal transduction histidine kinase
MRPWLLGLLAVLALAALGARAWMDLRQGLRDTEHMSLMIHQGFQAIQDLRFRVEASRRMALSALATRDPAEQVRFADRSREARKEVEALLSDLGPSPVPVGNVRAAWADYRLALDDVVIRLPSEAAGRDPSLSPSVGSRRFQRLEDRLTELSHAYSRYATQRADRIDAEITRAVSEVVLIWIAALVGIVGMVTHHHRRTVADQARHAAESVALAKSEFVAMISHEIRNPLSVLTGMASLLEESPLTPRQREWVAAGRAASAAVLSVVNNILDSARLDAGQVAVDPQPVDIRGIVRDSVEMVALGANRKGLTVTPAVDVSVPAVVLVDPTRVQQVLNNLLGNAVKFTHAGVVTLRADATPLAGTGELLLRFAVSDTGMGIEPDRFARLFEPFRQGDVSTHRLFGGSGLGLSICRRLAHLLGGDIQAESQPGVGSTFTFTCRASVLATGGGDPVRLGVVEAGTS